MAPTHNFWNRRKGDYVFGGVCLGQQDSNNPLEGENQDIYLGVNNWDAEYGGLVDTVRIYNIALSEEEVQGQAKEEYNNMLQEN